MIKAADGFLMDLAKKLITVAAFFGIDRKRLTKSWVLISYFSCFGARSIIYDIYRHNYPHIIVSFLIWSTASIFLFFLLINRHIEDNYREDNVISNSFGRPVYRVTAQLYFPTLSLVLILIPVLSSFFIISLFFLLPYNFYYYLLLNQSPQNPLRLRNLVKNSHGKIQQALKPSPQPQSEPIPTA